MNRYTILFVRLPNGEDIRVSIPWWVGALGFLLLGSLLGELWGI